MNAAARRCHSDASSHLADEFLQQLPLEQHVPGNSNWLVPFLRRWHAGHPNHPARSGVSDGKRTPLCPGKCPPPAAGMVSERLRRPDRPERRRLEGGGQFQPLFEDAGGSPLVAKTQTPETTPVILSWWMCRARWLIRNAKNRTFARQMAGMFDTATNTFAPFSPTRT